MTEPGGSRAPRRPRLARGQRPPAGALLLGPGGPPRRLGYDGELRAAVSGRLGRGALSSWRSSAPHARIESARGRSSRLAVVDAIPPLPGSRRSQGSSRGPLRSPAPAPRSPPLASRDLVISRPIRTTRGRGLGADRPEPSGTVLGRFGHGDRRRGSGWIGIAGWPEASFSITRVWGRIYIRGGQP